MTRDPKRVAIVGGGISGLIHAHVLRKNGFEPVVFEKAREVGGVWAVAYPGVRLQNLDFHYHVSDFPWPSPPDPHPTGEQIRAYWSAFVDALGLDVRLGHEAVAAEERPDGWSLTTRCDGVERTETYDFLVVAIGQYTDGKHRPRFDGEERFRGAVGTERDARAPEDFSGRRVAVVGFGKSALDMAAAASERGAEVHHVFRTARWALPKELLGVHMSWFLFNRFGSVMMTSWAHPTAAERFLHRELSFIVKSFWRGIEAVFRWDARRHARGTGPEGMARVERVLPKHPVGLDLRSAAAIAPDGYFRRVAEGKIVPHHAAVTGFDEEGLRLDDGTRVACDRVVLSLGSESPRFPFLPEKYRAMLEGEPDGAQLYRHIVHPRIPRLGFAGFNHGFMHVPAAEVGAQWLACLFRGDLALPPPEAMERSVERVRAWKRAHIAFEPSRSCAVNTRYQQYIDILLGDLGVSPYRKLPNVLAEVFARYGASDYAGVFGEVPPRGARPREPLPLDT